MRFTKFMQNSFIRLEKYSKYNYNQTAKHEEKIFIPRISYPHNVKEVSDMKRKLSVLLAALLCTLSLVSCGAPPAGISESAESSGKTSGSSSSGTVDKDALRVCVDLEYRAGYTEGKTPENAFYNLMNTVKSLGGPENVSFEYLPREGTERETALDRVRTEIMSGGGPDMFIIACNGGIDYMAADVEALFRVPEKAMEAGLFLPLDDYIQNAQFMEWNKLNETVMAAGRTEQGQMLLPMTYTFPLTMFRESDVTLTTTAETTWQDMLNDKTNVLTAAANWIPTMEEQENFENQCGGPLLPYILGDLADYSSEKLLFTEEELLQRITDVIELDVRNKNGEFENVPPYYHWFACGGLTGSDFADPHVKVRDQGPITMMPLYSDDGGMTAAVTSYVAINRSTKHADEAFFLADLLLRKETQLSSALYSEWLVYNDSVGIPVYADAMQDTSPVTWHGMTDWHMSAENYENFSAARSQITRVRFQGGLEEALVNCYYACSDARYQDPNADLAPIIAEWYKTMEQWVQE
mgnify:FL=1